uniref:DUF2934 domain-containing protein n=1 Tax=Candidatus Nitrotoga fabula TaxID=2182327 RepID=A0A2X0RGI6_9PROT|nr:protein of unknown function [Candidatus Nitrotoga fabula]
MENALYLQKESASPIGVKRTRRKASTGKRKADVSPEKRQQMIAEAAYMRALNRNFEGGDPEADWYAAEAEIRLLISRGDEFNNKP